MGTNLRLPCENHRIQICARIKNLLSTFALGRPKLQMTDETALLKFRPSFLPFSHSLSKTPLSLCLSYLI